MTRLRHSPGALAARMSLAVSLAQSAATFRALGKIASAELSESMIADAVKQPALYRHWADQQQDRANEFRKLLNQQGVL